MAASRLANILPGRVIDFGLTILSEMASFTLFKMIASSVDCKGSGTVPIVTSIWTGSFSCLLMQTKPKHSTACNTQVWAGQVGGIVFLHST